MGPCMCGDPYCHSCGSAMGANPEFEAVCEWLMEVLDPPPAIDPEWLAEHVANCLQTDEELAEAMLAAAKRHARAQRTKSMYGLLNRIEDGGVR